MALITCPECGNQVSDQAVTCIHCGYPLKKSDAKNNPANGLYQVRLVNVGVLKIEVIKLVKEITGADLNSAKRIVESKYPIIVSNKQKEECEKVQGLFSSIGAKTTIEENDKQTPPDEIPIMCPVCGSTSITTGARGVNGVFGIFGASKTVNRCAKCGHTWDPSKR